MHVPGFVRSSCHLISHVMPPTLPSAGQLLFSDADWLQLVARVTAPTMPLLADDRRALVQGLPGELGSGRRAGCSSLRRLTHLSLVAGM
jgi:hypothetical protein